MMDTDSTPVPEQPGEKSPAAEAKKTRRNRKVKRSLAGAFALTVGLTGAGVLATALTPDAQVATAQRDDQALIQEGNDIYDVACITCHGANLQGVEDRGPRSEEHTSELQSRGHLVCRLLLEKKKKRRR